MDDITKLQTSLIDIANKTVGNVLNNGEISLPFSNDFVKNDFVEFGVVFDDLSQIKRIWFDWIENYIKFVSLKVDEDDRIEEVNIYNKNLVLSWRKYPEIIKFDHMYIIEARLNISKRKEQSSFTDNLIYISK